MVSFGLLARLVTVPVITRPSGATLPDSSFRSISPSRVNHRPCVSMISSSGPDFEARPTTVIVPPAGPSSRYLGGSGTVMLTVVAG